MRLLFAFSGHCEVNEMLQQLRYADARSDLYFVPLAVNLLKEMEPPTPTESAARTPQKNDRLSLVAVEAYWRQTDI